MKKQLKTLWCIQANVVKQRPFGEGGREGRNGIKLFRGGAKVYIIGGYAGMCESVVVIGYHRYSVKLICSVVRANHLENFRVKPIYNPKIAEIAENYSNENNSGVSVFINDEELANNFAKTLPFWF